MRTLSFLLTVFLLSLHLPALAKTSCSSFPPPLKGSYCVHPSTTGSKDIAYYLHGRGGDAAQWKDPWYYTSQIQTYWKEHQLSSPTVISISFGEVWLLAKQNSSSSSGLLDLLVAKIIPTIESQLGGLQGERLVFGESMGGFNSIQLILKTNLFSRAATICAPMSEVSPFAEEKDILDYVHETAAWQYYKDHSPQTVWTAVRGSVALAKHFYPSPAEWAEADPIQLAKATEVGAKLYVSVGYYDPYVNYEGNERFVEILKAKGADVEWRPMWGGHCVVDIPSVANFLSSRP